LVREVPEAMKPRRIAIKSGHAAAESQQVDHKTAAWAVERPSRTQGLGGARRGPRDEAQYAMEATMSVKDLIPWNRERDVTVRQGEEANPFLALHREMNRLFDDAFRGFDLAPFGFGRGFDRTIGWPNIEVSDTDQEMKLTAELPGLEEKDVALELANGVLVIKGEKKTETEDKDRLFSERYYGRFERRIPVEGVDEDKISASFRNGVLTVTLPKTAQAQRQVKRIAINGR
jgi:HSP20 family protein